MDMTKITNLTLAALLVLAVACSKDAATGDTGTGGSMARFTIKDNYLYTVDHESLLTFSIANPSNLLNLSHQYLGFGIETIFPTEEHLFIGARNGMHIYGLSDPAKPNKLSFTPHFVSYDPVVVQGNYAYVTLRSAENMTGGRNELLIFDISNPKAPILAAEYNMVWPRGLGIDGDKLFICDDRLKVFILDTPTQIRLLESFDIRAIDVIPSGGHLFVVAEDGLYQYSYDSNGISLISKLTLPKS